MPCGHAPARGEKGGIFRSVAETDQEGPTIPTTHSRGRGEEPQLAPLPRPPARPSSASLPASATQRPFALGEARRFRYVIRGANRRQDKRRTV